MILTFFVRSIMGRKCLVYSNQTEAKTVEWEKKKT